MHISFSDSLLPTSFVDSPSTSDSLRTLPSCALAGVTWGSERLGDVSALCNAEASLNLEPSIFVYNYTAFFIVS